MNYLGFPTGIGYLSSEFPYSTSRPHKGIDLKANHGTPILVSGVQIGLVGETGYTFGPHVHVQAGRDVNAQQTIDPAPYIGKPGTVYKTGTASEWGNFVCLKVGDVYVYYCHLSRIDVKEGQVIGGKSMTQSQAEKVVTYLYRLGTKDYPTPGQADYWVARVRDVPTGLDELGGEMLKAREQDDSGEYVETKVYIKK